MLEENSRSCLSISYRKNGVPPHAEPEGCLQMLFFVWIQK